MIVQANQPVAGGFRRRAVKFKKTAVGREDARTEMRQNVTAFMNGLREAQGSASKQRVG
jgi:hypothetical protein